MPSERAAARWLSWTPSIPPRMISATYAEYDSTSVTVPQITGFAHGPRQPRAGHAEPDQEDQQDHRDAAEHVGVDDGQRLQREQRRAAGAAGERHDERHDQDQRRRPQQDLDVEPERVEQARERVDEHVAVEERLADLVPTRRQRNEHDQRHDDDGRARRGDHDRRAVAVVRS